MLVGNHDQISVGGLAHALKPLAAACSAIQVLEVPTLYKGALWLPYRKDHTEVKAALEAAGSVKAVFAHADVVRIHRALNNICSHGVSTTFTHDCKSHATSDTHSSHPDVIAVGLFTACFV